MLPYFFATTLFLLYIQFSPKMGNIWYRNGHFVPMGALRVAIYPFKNYRMWNPEIWDINYPVWLIATKLVMSYKKLNS